MDGLVLWLKELAVFIVVCETILSFSPSGVYKKYIKPFVGLILLLRISAFLFGTIEVDWNERIDAVFNEYEQSVNRYLENVPVIEEISGQPEEVPKYDLVQEDEKLNDDSIKVDKIVVSPIRIGEKQ